MKDGRESNKLLKTRYFNYSLIKGAYATHIIEKKIVVVGGEIEGGKWTKGGFV